MSEGLWALMALAADPSRAEMRDLRLELFLESEVPAFEFFRGYYRDYGDIPTLEVLQQNGHVAQTMPTGAFRYHLDRMRTRAVHNVAVDGQQVLNAALQARSADQIMDAIRQMAVQVGTVHANTNLETMTNLATRVLEDAVIVRNVDTHNSITLGWEPIDRVTGGMQQSDLVAIVARPNVGKSYTIAWMALKAWLMGNTILFVSMEMTDIQMARRIIGVFGGTNPDRLRRGTMSDVALARLSSRCEQFGQRHPFYMVQGGLRQSTADIDNLVQELRPDAVYIDASYLLRPEGGGRGNARWENLSDVHEALKSCALSRRLPMAFTVQMNREGGKTKRGGGLGNIAGTDVIAQIATIVVDIREGDAPHQNDQRRYTILKNREGPLGDFTTAFEFEPFRFSWLQEVDAERARRLAVAEEQRTAQGNAMEILTGGMQ